MEDVREAIMVPWRLDSGGRAHRPPNVEVVAEVEAALGAVLDAETSTEGYRRLVYVGTECKRTGAYCGGSWGFGAS